MGYFWCLSKASYLVNVVSRELQSIGLSMSKGPKITKGMNCIENNFKLKGKNNEKFHSEMINCFEVLVTKIWYKRDNKI